MGIFNFQQRQIRNCDRKAVAISNIVVIARMFRTAWEKIKVLWNIMILDPVNMMDHLFTNKRSPKDFLSHRNMGFNISLASLWMGWVPNKLIASRFANVSISQFSFPSTGNTTMNPFPMRYFTRSKKECFATLSANHWKFFHHSAVEVLSKLSCFPSSLHSVTKFLSKVRRKMETFFGTILFSWYFPICNFDYLFALTAGYFWHGITLRLTTF